jgi:predicted GIY-YIG superfamily endonuclease
MGLSERNRAGEDETRRAMIAPVESPLPHHSTHLPARFASRKARSWRAIHHVECPERAIGRPQADQLRVEGQLRIEARRWHRRRVAHYVYLLRCADNSLYVGETSDLQARERDHNEGRGGSYTAKRRPVHIVYAEQYRSREEALTRERQIKRWSAQKKELLVRGDLAALSGSSQRARIRTGFTWEDWLPRRK